MIDYMRPTPPKISFGSKGMKLRAQFLTTMIKDGKLQCYSAIFFTEIVELRTRCVGYCYSARPATAETGKGRDIAVDVSNSVNRFNSCI